MKSYEEYAWPMRNPEHRPFRHQVMTTEFLLRNKRAYVLSDIGTGKTLSALWATDILFEMGAIRKVLIITPLSTVQVVWGAEIFTNFPHRYYGIAHGTRDDRIRVIRSGANYVIINHDGVKTVLPELMSEGFDIVIIDEMTAYKNAMSDRSKIMRKWTGRLKGVWGMTGCPTPNSPVEAYGQAKVVNPYNPYLPRYFGQYRDMVVQQVAMGVFVPKPDANNVVHHVLQPSIRFTRDECLDLPPVLKQYVQVDMTATQKKLYEDMKRELYAQYERGEITAVNAGVKMGKLLQISAGAVIDDNGEICYCDSLPKIDSILETFEELGRTKLIVVASYRAVVERLCEIMRSREISCEFIHGGVGIRERSASIDAFQNGSLQMLIVQPEAVAHGITLTAANTIVWHSFVASGETYLQMNGRITRAGQTRKQYVRHLVCSATELHIVKLLEKKENLALEILGLFARQEL